MMLFVGIKFSRGNRWKLVDLDQADGVINKMEELDRLLWRNNDPNEEPAAWYNSLVCFRRRHNRSTIPETVENQE